MRDGSLERLNFALKSARMGAFDFDLAAGTMLWDGRMHELFGIPPGSFSGKYLDFLALVHSEDRPKAAREITAALGERSEFAVEFRIVRPSDSAVRFLEMSFKVPSDTDGSHEPTIGVCQEVTEQRCTGDALVRERFILRTIMDNIPDRVYFKDRESRFTLVNYSFLRRAGFEEQSEMIGKTDKDLFTDEHAFQGLADEQRIIATGEPIVDIEEKETWHEGRVAWYSTSKMPLYPSARRR